MTDGDLTPREVADRLGVTVRTVQRWVAAGTLPATRVGARVRVSPMSLAAVADADPQTRRPARAITTLLIANRGEIAARIARSARAMGIRPIGVHVADERPPHGMAEAHIVESYLDGAELLRVAAASSADAVHPGYGFLAENPRFATAVAAAGLAWVGPPPDAIAAMGDKAAARRHAASLGVPVVPGYDRDAQDDATLAAEAGRIGFPILVKPSAGGGGKGMRVVREPAGVTEALGAARREAERSFGDDRLILERYLEAPRHVEIQVLFDASGAGVHLGERDCSAQRRNQKIVEEAPAPAVDAALRERMGDSALRLASSVNYVGAGTVEMLLGDGGAFYFLEMNTRLQVEHPVTEAVTGRDLVRDQLRIAMGESLAALGLPRPPRIDGHAVEARIYAEDPESGFLPATGRLVHLRWPSGVRIDTGVEEGDRVGDRFDPMLAKVVAHGRTRAAAIARLRQALDEMTVLGVRTNVRFLRWLLDEPVVRAGDIRTDTIDRIGAPAAVEAADPHWSAAARALGASSGEPWAGGWRLNAGATLRVRCADAVRTVVQPPRASDPALGPTVVRDGAVVHVDVDGQSVEFALAPPPSVNDVMRRTAHEAGAAASGLSAPMPGRVVAVRGAAGSVVEAGTPLIVIEAMKMEHAVVAPGRIRVSQVLVSEGQQVQRGDLLAEVEPYHEPDG